MAKRKSLLKKTEVEVTKRSRRCKHKRTTISIGQTCLVVFDDPRQRFCYSRDIALQMIQDARELLNEIEARLLGQTQQLNCQSQFTL